MITRLSEIFKNIYKKKFREGYIKYLRSLDFEEFDFIYHQYAGTVAVLHKRYESKNHKFLSKNWINLKILTSKFKVLYYVFHSANKDFMKKSFKLLEERNSKSLRILTEINEVKATLKNLENKTLMITQNPNSEDIISITSYFVSNIYNNQRLQELLDELKKK